MSFEVPHVGEQEALERIVNSSAADDLKLHLYSDDVTPAEGDTVASYTLVTDPAAKTLTGSSWTVNTGTASYDQQTFSFSGAATVYGYVITNNAGTILIAAEDFSDGPYTIPSGGGTIKVTPQISLD